MSNPSTVTISVHYSWATGLLLGDFHLSELERLDKPRAKVGRELTPFKTLVDDETHLAISSLSSVDVIFLTLFIQRTINFHSCWLVIYSEKF